MRTLGITLAALALLLVGCGESDGASDRAAATTSAAPGETVGPTPTEPAVIRVSAETACELMFKDKVLQRTVEEVNTFAKAPDGTQSNYGAIDDVEKELRSWVERAPEEMSPHLEVQADTLAEIKEVLGGAPDRTIDTTSFRASGVEVANMCS